MINTPVWLLLFKFEVNQMWTTEREIQTPIQRLLSLDQIHGALLCMDDNLYFVEYIFAEWLFCVVGIIFPTMSAVMKNLIQIYLRNCFEDFYSFNPRKHWYIPFPSFCALKHGSFECDDRLLEHLWSHKCSSRISHGGRFIRSSVAARQSWSEVVSLFFLTRWTCN